MKKIVVFFIMIMLIWSIFLVSTVSAYSKDGYTVNIPSSYIVDLAYTSTDTDNKLYTWINSENGTYITISIGPNDLKNNITEENVKNRFLQGFEDENWQYLLNFANIDIEKIELVKLNGVDSVHSIIKCSSRYINGYSESYIMLTKEYEYSICIFSPIKSYLSSTEAQNIFNSFKVSGTVSFKTSDEKTVIISKFSKSDSDDEKNVGVIVAIIVGIAILVLLIIIVVVLFKRKSRKLA